MSQPLGTEASWRNGTDSSWTAAVLWTVWLCGCVFAVAALWFYAFIQSMTFFSTPITPQQTSTSRILINAAAITSATSAVLMFVIAGRSRSKLSTAAIVALVLGFLAPWPPVFAAVVGRVAGE